MNLRELQEIVQDKGAWCAIVCEAAKSQTQLSDWTTITEASPDALFSPAKWLSSDTKTEAAPSPGTGILETARDDADVAIL